jgi:plastocyanin
LKSLILTVVSVLALMIVVGGQPRAAGAQEKSAPNEVKIENFVFAPVELTVSAGTSVTWINRDDVPHTIVSVNGKFRSNALDTDDKYSHTFANPGTYEYFCSVHPKMTGKIIVK